MFRRFDSALVRLVPVAVAVALLAPAVQAQNPPLPAAKDIIALGAKLAGKEAPVPQAEDTIRRGLFFGKKVLR